MHQTSLRELYCSSLLTTLGTPFSSFLRSSETCYSTFDRELLAVYLAIRHYCHFLEGRHFQVLMDHKPLTYALHARPDHHSPRQARQLDFISQFTSNIHHVHGSENVVADALSHIELNALISGQPPVVDFAAMAKAQATDPQVRTLQSSPSSPLVVVAVPLANSSDTLLCNISAGPQRPLLPRQWRCTVFDFLHDLLTQIFEQHSDLSLLDMCGQVSMLMCADGHVPTSSANEQRSSVIPLPHSPPFPYLMPDLTLFTLILSNHFHHHKDSPIS